MRTGFPLARPGQRIGLLGGSFDPAHSGHVQISKAALRRLHLDRVWWLVSPGNPLKARGPAPLDLRLQAARDLIHDPRIVVTDLEARMGLRMTADTLAALARLYPGVRFVWLMGSDNMAQFHHWDRWRQIAGQVPIAVLARPGTRLSARQSVAAGVLRAARLPETRAGELALRAAPAWVLLNLPMSPLSSTSLRGAGA
ncbi:nicotinate-nucleotide adenylyltransferase [Paracoccus gahaiensis]|uniref:Probable nicotinate-nucleotide adenylyltransferase n=1 Tax=Paracoccus gahaiensis TaxID=1706839 RepID=A0A4U0RH40_9RHOB|nr:nicotinate-nucleotide adenylyltransferase [Paracoccus gahaiensis]TJZ94020.1 nicotinate-nucleotide adenylyltransferase [Paracoccus gahaiensis]